MCGRAKGGDRTWSNCDRLQLPGPFPAVLKGDGEGSPVGLGEPVEDPVLGVELEAARPELELELACRHPCESSILEEFPPHLAQGQAHNNNDKDDSCSL